ncbi:MAG: hypothetical protein BroJett015_31820 [Chloroflexota bacterium]|nr:MAG: hypothetical protein BroJett015_31820 [Chloroflexota bacterium]
MGVGIGSGDQGVVVNTVGSTVGVWVVVGEGEAGGVRVSRRGMGVADGRASTVTASHKSLLAGSTCPQAHRLPATESCLR